MNSDELKRVEALEGELVFLRGVYAEYGRLVSTNGLMSVGEASGNLKIEDQFFRLLLCHSGLTNKYLDPSPFALASKYLVLKVKATDLPYKVKNLEALGINNPPEQPIRSIKPRLYITEKGLHYIQALLSNETLMKEVSVLMLKVNKVNKDRKKLLERALVNKKITEGEKAKNMAKKAKKEQEEMVIANSKKNKELKEKVIFIGF